MSSTRAPMPLRILVAWPGLQAISLRRALAVLGADVTCVDASTLAGHMTSDGYYHLLVARPKDWLNLPVAVRRRFAQRVPLIVLGPESAIPTDLGEARAGCYFPGGATLSNATEHLAHLVQCIMAGSAIDACAAEHGDMAFVGAVARWPNITTGHPEPQGETRRTGPEAGRPSPMGSPAVGIGVLNAAGDVVYGTKEIHNAAGDQINLGPVSADKLVQHAGGDQINVNRLAGSPTDGTHVAAPADHASGQGTPVPTAFCDQCGEPMNAIDVFCEHCGSRQ